MLSQEISERDVSYDCDLKCWRWDSDGRGLACLEGSPSPGLRKSSTVVRAYKPKTWEAEPESQRVQDHPVQQPWLHEPLPPKKIKT